MNHPMTAREESVLYWTWCADTYCDYCARKAFGNRALDDGLADTADYPLDGEGNYVQPAFTHPHTRIFCGGCHVEIQARRSNELALAEFEHLCSRGRTYHPLAYDPEDLPHGFWNTVEREFLDYWGTIEFDHDDDPVSTCVDSAMDEWAADVLRMNREAEAATYDRDFLSFMA